MVFMMIELIKGVSAETPENSWGPKIEVLFNHLEKCAGVGSQIDVALLSALSIDYT